MTKEERIERLRILQKKISDCESPPNTGVRQFQREAEMLIKNFIEDSENYLFDLTLLSMKESSFETTFRDGTTIFHQDSWDSYKTNFINLIDIIIEEFNMNSEKNTDSNNKNLKKETSKYDIFIIHGHNNEMKEAVARLLEKIGLNPIILHEQPNKGKTTIEKLMNHSEKASFAIALFSPDDFGYAVKEGPKKKKNRPRQNVVFETGLFIGLLSREKVILLRHPQINDIFSDFQGVVYHEYDSGGAWKYRIIEELQAAEYDVDKNKIV